MTERKDHNSSVNQSIKRKFVEREVVSLANSLVEYILKQNDYSDDAPFSWDDIENLYVYPETTITIDNQKYYFDGGSEEDKENFIDYLQQKKSDNDALNEENDELWESIESDIDNAISEIENLETEPQEIYEWWIVSDFLYNELLERGEPVLTDGYLRIWGRCCTGQAILLDHVISEICDSMEILDGQKYSWADKN